LKSLELAWKWKISDADIYPNKQGTFILAERFEWSHWCRTKETYNVCKIDWILKVIANFLLCFYSSDCNLIFAAKIKALGYISGSLIFHFQTNSKDFNKPIHVLNFFWNLITFFKLWNFLLRMVCQWTLYYIFSDKLTYTDISIHCYF